MWGGSSCFSSFLGMLKKSFVYRQYKCFHGDPFCFWLPQDTLSSRQEEDAAQGKSTFTGTGEQDGDAGTCESH